LKQQERVKLKKKTIRPATHKACRERKPPVSVVMMQQSILPLCVDAVSECLKHAAIPPRKIFIDNSTFDTKLKLWLDALLFKEALVDLLEDAAKRCDRQHRIVVCESSAGMHCCRLLISYTRQKAEDAFRDDQFEMPYFSHDRTREIISQHRAAMKLVKDGRKVTIEVSFP
jgi:hypothetical protein